MMFTIANGIVVNFFQIVSLKYWSQQYDNRKILNRDIAKSVNNYFKEKIFKTLIRDNIALAEAPVQEKDIFSYDAKSNGAKDYESLISEILN